MKIIYTEADVTSSGAQLLICPASLDNLYSTTHERRFRRAFPEAAKVVGQMLTESNIVTKDMLPHISDVIWVETPGNKHLGFCLIRETRDDDINMNALKVALKSVNQKAIDLEQPVIGMDLFACETPKDWIEIVDVVEKSLPSVQAFVCMWSDIPGEANKLLNEVIDSLPGPKVHKVLDEARG